MHTPRKIFSPPAFNNVVQRTLTGIILGAVFWATYTALPPWCFTALLAGIFLIIVIDEWKNFYSPNSLGFWITLPIYPGIPFAMLMYLSSVPAYRPILLILFVLAFANDTGAYITGSLIGRNCIAPTVSPKKTWEGFIGGYASALVALFIITNQSAWCTPIWLIFSFSLTMCVLFLIGDLFESKLKRQAGIKDSGSLLPGHGGFLDRFDGILFATILCYLLRTVLLQWLAC